MNDMISRQDALDAIEERIKANGYVNVALISELNRLDGYIRQLPSAQRKGKWLEKKVIPVYENGFPLQSCKCSECDRYDTRPYMYYFFEPNFCGYCGAEMMKGESDGRQKQ